MPHPTAILVDGDNLSARHAAAILKIGRTQGDATIIRTYLDARTATDWHGANGYRLVHAGCGKNATDVLMAIEAMDLAHLHAIRSFVIASSDGDFTHLTLRLRELGAQVTGVGESKAPQAFRASCSAFVELASGKPAVQGCTRPASQTGPRLVSTGVASVSELDRQIRAMIAQHSTKGEGMRIADLAPKMHVAHGIRISTLPEKTWRSYLLARPGLFDLDPRGPDAKVRFRPGGFAAAA
jgi:uncharacterized LabA/DUF88 family protein